MRLYVAPEPGHPRLDRLGPAHVASLLHRKLSSGLSPRPVHHVRAVVRAALNQAVKWQLVPRNAGALVSSPRQKTSAVESLTLDEAQAILDAARAHRLAALFRVALTMGLRQGEVLGLRWTDVDLDARTLRVARVLQYVDGQTTFKEPKTAKSRRTLRLPASVAEALREHRRHQLVERAAVDTRWTDSGLVFVSTVGTPLNPRNVLRIWHGRQDRAGVTRGPFHASRHTAISLLIAEGLQMKVIQEVAGHSLLSTTADIYGHLFPPAFAEAADAMDRVLE